MRLYTFCSLRRDQEHEATKLLEGSMVFQEAMSELLEKQRNRQHDILCLITYTRANRVAIVSLVITKIFNPSKYWTVTTQPSVICSVFIHIHYQFSVIVISCVTLICFCLAFIRITLFDYSVFDYLFIQCIFCPDTGIVFQVF
jgi:hypothetical protein